MKKGVAYFILWMVITLLGYIINQLFNEPNSNKFREWRWEYLTMPFVFSLVLILSEKHNKAMAFLYAIFFSIVLLCSVAMGDISRDAMGSNNYFNQMGLEAIECGSSLIFLHNELLLQGSVIIFSEIIPLKWAFCIGCVLIIASTTYLLLFLIKLAGKLTNCPPVPSPFFPY